MADNLDAVIWLKLHDELADAMKAKGYQLTEDDWAILHIQDTDTLRSLLDEWKNS